MIRYVLAKLWFLVASLTILVAVLFSIGRALFPYIEHYSDEVSAVLSDALQQPLTLGGMEATWKEGVGPAFEFHDIHFLDVDTLEEIIAFDRASIAIDIVGSVLTGSLRFGELTVTGVKLNLVRREDGTIGLEGVSTSAGRKVKKQNGEAVLLWLLSQRHLAIAGSEVLWRDRMMGEDSIHLKQVNLELRNVGSRHQFNGSAVLPAELGREVSFAIDLTGDVLVPNGWDGQVYLHGKGMQLSRLARFVTTPPVDVQAGVVDLQMWTTWGLSRLEHVDAQLSLFGLELASVDKDDNNKYFKLDALSGRVAWELRSNGWELALDRLVIGRDGRLWPFSHLNLAYRKHQQQDEIELSAEYLALQELSDLAGLIKVVPLKVKQVLKDLQPEGDLEHVHLLLRKDDHGMGIHMLGSFNDLGTRASGRLPGVKGADGRFMFRNDAGVIEFTSRDTELDAPKIFRDILTLKNMTGQLAWSIRPQAVQLSVRNLQLQNDDLRMHLHGDVAVPHAKEGTEPRPAPYMDLQVRFDSSAQFGRHLSRYLPTGILKPTLTGWLGQAFTEGRVNYGGMVFRGRLNQFPFDKGDGRFEVRFGVEDAEMIYTKGWPELTGLTGELVFSGRQFEANVNAGHSFSTSIQHARVLISDMKVKPVLLEIQGRARGPAGDVLRYLSETPLKSRFGAYVEGVEAEGRVAVDLDLGFELGGSGSKTDGVLHLQNNNMFLAGRAVDFTGLTGALSFDAKGLRARGVTGKVLGMPAVFDIESQPRGAERVTRIVAEGEVTAEDVYRLVDIPLFKYLDGRSKWRGLMEIFEGEQSQSTLLVESDLQGMASSLPYPVNKQADENWPLSLTTSFPRALDEPVYITLADKVTGILDLDDVMLFERGELRFGGGEARLPDRMGMQIAGKIDAFPFSQWLPYFEEAGEKDDGEGGGVNQIDVQVGLLEMFGYGFSEAVVSASQDKDVWQIVAKSNEMEGNIRVPLGPALPISAELKYLSLVTDGGVSDSDDETDPREMPPMQVSVESFHFDGINFGRMDMRVSKRPAGLHLDSLQMRSPVMEIDARGDWVYVNGEQLSSFSIAFNSDNFGKALARLGFAETISNGRSKINIVARWDGSPETYALDKLEGTMSIKVADGHVLDVEPGAGRLLGLISLQALPRRLVLDFSDIFQKGFAFDLLKGNFSFADGHAVTSDLYVDGPAARVDIRGRVGLVAKDYDQHVYVKPHLSSGLPVAGVVAGGLGFGAVILVIQELLRPSIKEASEIEYEITGSWDEPVIKQVNKR